MGDGAEHRQSAQTKLYFPPPNEDEEGATWARVDMSGRKFFYAFVRDDNVVRSWKRLNRIEDERIVRLQTQVCLLRDIAPPERNWLDAKIIPLPDQQRLLATGKYPFRVTFDRDGRVNQKLIMQKCYVRCKNPLAKQVGAEKGLPTRVDHDGRVLGRDKVKGQEVDLVVMARPGVDVRSGIKAGVPEAVGQDNPLMPQQTQSWASYTVAGSLLILQRAAKFGSRTWPRVRVGLQPCGSLSTPTQGSARSRLHRRFADAGTLQPRDRDQRSKCSTD